jgi:hypothetical protein
MARGHGVTYPTKTPHLHVVSPSSKRTQQRSHLTESAWSLRTLVLTFANPSLTGLYAIAWESKAPQTSPLWRKSCTFWGPKVHRHASICQAPRVTTAMRMHMERTMHTVLMTTAPGTPSISWRPPDASQSHSYGAATRGLQDQQQQHSIQTYSSTRSPNNR